MRDRSFMTKANALASLVAAAMAMPALTTAAPAQGLIFDWDGEKTVDSGKTHMKIAGGAKPGEIVVSFADRKLYFFTAPGEADVYPVATPRDQSRWEGVTSVTQKRENPSWTPTAHMLSENPKLPRWVPGGHPMNPLGIRALYLGSSDYRIHGTDAPWTIGTPVSKGCVRMFNKDVVDLYPRVKVGTKVLVTWQKFDGKVMNIAETKGIKELPPLGDANAVSPVPANGKPAIAAASAAGDDATPAPRSKWRKHAVEDEADATTPLPEKAVLAAQKASDDKAAVEKVKAAAASDDEPAIKKRKPRKADIDEAAATGEGKAIKKAEKADEPTADAKKDDAKEPVKTAAEADAVPEPKREKRVRTAAHSKSGVKTDANVETGAIPAAAKKADELGVAEKALAAAERAAAAAERAAAAAERAVAASQVRPAPDAVAATPAVVATPAVTAPAEPAAAPAAATPAGTN